MSSFNTHSDSDVVIAVTNDMWQHNDNGEMQMDTEIYVLPIVFTIISKHSRFWDDVFV